MRLMLHTLKKDARRLWPAAMVTWAMLAALTNADRWRADSIPSAMEGWMNLLLPLAWACLAALAVLEEPLVGDRNFWTTRPHRWTSLLGAKLIFLVLAIHVPSFAADSYVLAARGFAPQGHLGELVWKQVLFFGAVTLPALALASLVRNFAHFVVAVFAIAAGLAILNGGLQGFSGYREPAGEVRHAAVRLSLAVAAIAVAGMQYARRRLWGARITAMAAALAAAALSAWLPARAEYALAATGQPRIELREAAAGEAPGPAGAGGLRIVRLPIAIRGAGASGFRVPLVEIEIVAPDGSVIRSANPSPNRPFEKIDLLAYTFRKTSDDSPDWLMLRFAAPAWERVKNGRVFIRGTAALEYYRRGSTTTMATNGSMSVPELGRCTAMTVDDRFSEGMLKVLCESPAELPSAAIVLRHAASGREWRLRLMDAMTYSPGPHGTWLSPLHRGQSFFRLTDADAQGPGSQRLVPASYVAESRVEITPDVVTGHALAKFEFDGVELGRR